MIWFQTLGRPSVEHTLSMPEEATPSTVSGRTILLVGLVAAVVFFALTYLAMLAIREDFAVGQAPLSWAQRADWPSPPVRRVTLERGTTNYGFNRPTTKWKDVHFELTSARIRDIRAQGAASLAAAEASNATPALREQIERQTTERVAQEAQRIEEAIRQCAALARLADPHLRSSEHAGPAMDVPFTDPSVRERIEAIAAEQPDLFYAHYLLGTWYRVNGDAARADELYEKAFALAPAAIKLCFVDPGDQGVGDLKVGAMEITFDRVIDGELDQTLKLVYPHLVTDAAGYVYLPTFHSVYRFTALPEIEGHNVRYSLEGWYQFPGKVGAPRPAMVWPR